MSKTLEMLRQVHESGDIAPLVDIMPYSQFLGISVDTSRGELIGKLTFSEELIGNPSLPALHGGTIGALLESTAIFTVIRETETSRMPKTINITVEYLRTGRPVDTYAAAQFTRLGRRVANVRAFAWQEDRNKPIAAANAHFLLGPSEE